MSHRLARRLFIAFLVIAATAAVCWKVLPRVGVTVAWWVPFIAFAVIVLATLGTMGRPESSDDDDKTGSLKLVDEDEGEGVSAADREKFG